MRKLILLFAFALLAYGASAQIRVGGGLGYGTDISEVGLNIRGLYQINDNIGAQADFMFYFVGENLSYTEFNVNGNYFFGTEQFRPYALAGLNISRLKASVPFFGSITDTEIGLNVGGGGMYDINDMISVFGEAKYIVSNADQLVITAGVLFMIF